MNVFLLDLFTFFECCGILITFLEMGTLKSLFKDKEYGKICSFLFLIHLPLFTIISLLIRPL